MRIQWLGHSCFKITHEGYAIVLDPYKPNMIPGLGTLDLSADMVLCSHEHGDHNNRAAVRLIEPVGKNPFTIVRIPSFHDAEKGARRGANMLTALAAGGFRIAHLGDLGCALEAEQIAALRHVDALLIPVGGYYTIDAVAAKKICDQLEPKIIVPMHYRGASFGPGVIDTVDRFTVLFDSVLIRRPGSDTIELDQNTPHQVTVLSLQQSI